MTKSKLITAAALVTTLGLSMALLSAPVSAGKRDGDPPLKQRDVITDAGDICELGPTNDNLIAACELRRKTDGILIDGVGCPGGNGLLSDATVVMYLLRNCDKNEESLLRYASSAVLSLDDFLAREKLQQAATAANYLCGYADKYALLVGAGKLEATEDLGEDAKDLADAITGTDFYCDL